ncbi:MAG TPA: AI-2E family transporter [Alphaproteobacteria bacterium]|nr:AI-2E family transporter [Alphaproteobacteria bacterium]
MIKTNDRVFWLLLLGASFYSLGYVISSLSGILMPFVVGLLGAYTLNTFVTFLVKWKVPRSLASGIAVLGVITSIVLFLFVLIPFFQSNLLILAVHVPGLVEKYFQDVQKLLHAGDTVFNFSDSSHLKQQFATHIGDIFNFTSAFLGKAMTQSLAFASFLSMLVVTPVVMFYLLNDWNRVVKACKNALPKAYSLKILEISEEIHAMLSSFVRGQSKVCLLLSICYSTAFWVLGLKNAFFIGFLTGMLSFVPYLGMVVGFMLSLIVAFAQGQSSEFILLLGAIFVVIAIIEGNLLTPRLVGKKIGLHPVWVIFSVFATATIVGLSGVLLALPLAAIIRVVSKHFYAYYQETEFYKKAS